MNLMSSSKDEQEESPLNKTAGQGKNEPKPLADGVDVIVVGASAGGVEATQDLVSGLPRDLNAAVFIVIHFPTNATSLLPQILNRRSPMPVSHASNGEAIIPGHIYVAPVNYHILLKNSKIHLESGPRVNGVRPSIDILFRSAAEVYGERVVGVLLSGTMDDGVEGLVQIQKHGGRTIVQDPTDAVFPALPMNALEVMQPDYVLPMIRIPKRLTQLSNEPVNRSGVRPMSTSRGQESQSIQDDIRAFEDGSKKNGQTMLTCPACGGTLWEYEEGKLLKFRCHVGHVFSEESVYNEKDLLLESALWTAVRSLEEKASLARRLAHKYGFMDRPKSVRYYREQADKAEESARLIRDALLKDGFPPDSPPE